MRRIHRKFDLAMEYQVSVKISDPYLFSFRVHFLYYVKKEIKNSMQDFADVHAVARYVMQLYNGTQTMIMARLL